MSLLNVLRKLPNAIDGAPRFNVSSLGFSDNMRLFKSMDVSDVPLRKVITNNDDVLSKVTDFVGENVTVSGLVGFNDRMFGLDDKGISNSLHLGVDVKGTIGEKFVGLFESAEPVDLPYAQSAEQLESVWVPEIPVEPFELPDESGDVLAQVADAIGFDIPEGLGDLPGITEIILGVRLVMDIVKVNGDYKQVTSDKKTRIAGVKALVLFSRFGVTSVLTLTGTAVGTAVVPVLGSLIGGIGGAMAASKINKVIKPQMNDIAMGLVGLTEEDLFYYRNYDRVNNLALRFRNSARSF